MKEGGETMTTVDKDEIDTLNWINAVYKLIAELTPDKEAYLKALERLDELVKEVNASSEDNR